MGIACCYMPCMLNDHFVANALGAWWWLCGTCSHWWMIILWHKHWILNENIVSCDWGICGYMPDMLTDHLDCFLNEYFVAHALSVEWLLCAKCPRCLLRILWHIPWVFKDHFMAWEEAFVDECHIYLCSRGLDRGGSFRAGRISCHGRTCRESPKTLKRNKDTRCTQRTSRLGIYTNL